MKICVTGGAGMIGSALVRKLIKSGYEVFVIDNLWRGKLSNLAGIDGFDIEDHFYELDLADVLKTEHLIELLSGTKTVIHLADIVAGIGYVFNNQYDIYRINNLINTNIFQASANAGVSKIIYAGTACSFPKTLQMSLDSVLKESDLYPAYPESAYGWSKLNGSLELEFLNKKYGIEVVTLMLHNVYGPYCDLDPKRSQVIPSLMRKMLELESHQTLEVWGSGNQGRAFVHTDDVTEAFLIALKRTGLPQVIQIGPNYCTSIKELVLMLKDDVLRKELKINFDTTKPEGDLGRCADYSLAKEVLEWTPKVNLLDGLRDTYNWVKGELMLK